LSSDLPPTAPAGVRLAEVIEPVSSKEISVMVLTAVETVDNSVDRCRERETTRV
jgi:hypothetical protein